MLVALLLMGLVILTAWNLTYSTALDEGARAYSRGDLTGALVHAFSHLSRQPWSRDAALLTANCLSRLDYCDEAEPYYRRPAAFHSLIRKSAPLAWPEGLTPSAPSRPTRKSWPNGPRTSPLSAALPPF